MDAKKLDAMRAAAAARARSSDRTANRQATILVKAGNSAKARQSGRSTRAVQSVLRKGGRFGKVRPVEPDAFE